jgi:xanthosine utilization system XapX-like protein
MDPSPVQAFILAVLDVGERLVGVVDDLIDGYEEATGCSNDEATAEILAMVFGTASVRMAAVPDEDFALATKLLRRTFTVVLADVEQAAELARQREFHAHPTSFHGRPV